MNKFVSKRPVGKEVEESSAKKMKLSAETDESPTADSKCEDNGSQFSTPAKASRPPKTEPPAVQKEFIRRLKFCMGTSDDENNDFHIYISSYDGIKRPTAVTFELIRHEDGEPKYKIPLTHSELNWLIDNIPSLEEMESGVGNFFKCPASKNNLSLEVIQAASGYIYLKVQTETRYKKFVAIGSAIAEKFKVNARGPYNLLADIDEYKRSYTSEAAFGLEVASSFFTVWVRRGRPSHEWKGLWKRISPLFGLSEFLMDEENIKTVRRMAIAGEVTPSSAEIMDTVFEYLN